MEIDLTKKTYWNKITSQSLINILSGGFLLLPLAKNIKRFFSRGKKLFIVIIAVAVSIGAGFGTFAIMKKDVIINDNGKLMSCKTMLNTVQETLEQNNIDVNACDYINVPLETCLQRKKLNEIYIKRAVPVYVTADGKQTEILTYKDTVAEMLEDSPIKIDALDRLEGAALQDGIKKDMSIRIVRVSENVVSEEEAIPFTVHKKANSRLDKGIEKIVQPGEEGIREKKYKVVTENGIEVSRQLLTEAILKNPINMIMEYGTILNHKTTRGDAVRYSKVIEMKATAYTASFKDTGKAPGHPQFGITKTGIKAKKGIIAVDPKVIPLYTKVYVEILGKTPDYGYALAADVGSAIKGNKIDLYYDTQEFVDRFGVQKVKVYILSND